MIWIKDIEGVYLLCNPEFEKFFGAKESEIIGKTDYDFVSKKQADFFRYHDNYAMNSNSVQINEEWVTYASNQKKYYLIPQKSLLGIQKINLLVY